MSPKKRLIGYVGAACCAILLATVPGYEGTRLQPYLDTGGVLTVCTGSTKNVENRVYAREECTERLLTDLADHAAGVIRCTPVLKDKPKKLAAATSFAFNVGVTNYCNSTTARRFNAGDFAGACKAMNESDTGREQWTTAGGVRLKGLVTRRASERALCEEKE